MNKSLIKWGLAVLFLASCASNQSNVDYDPTVNFAQYKKYAWSEKTDEQTGRSKIDTPLVHQRVRESIETALAAKGLQKVDTAQADILVVYHLSVAAVGPLVNGTRAARARSPAVAAGGVNGVAETYADDQVVSTVVGKSILEVEIVPAD